jgi:hypothetical protein
MHRGKSNLLDALRFLRDVSKSKGGGLQQAVADRAVSAASGACMHAPTPRCWIELK